MEVILYIAAIIAAIGFLILCVSVGMTLFSLKSILNSLAEHYLGLKAKWKALHAKQRPYYQKQIA